MRSRRASSGGRRGGALRGRARGASLAGAVGMRTGARRIVRRWGSLSACKARESALRTALWARGRSQPHARRLLLGRPAAARHPSRYARPEKNGFLAAKNKEGSHKGRRERRFIGLDSKLWGFTAAGSDAARRLSCDGPGTKAKLFLQPEAKLFLRSTS